MGLNLKKIIGTVGRVAEALDPTGILDLIIPDQVAKDAGTTPDIVERILGVIRENPEVARIRLEGQKMQAELHQALATLSSQNLQALDTRTPDDPKIVKVLRGGVRPFAVFLSTSVTCFWAFTIIGFAIFASDAWVATHLAPERFKFVELSFELLKWVTSVAIGFYAAGRTVEKTWG